MGYVQPHVPAQPEELMPVYLRQFEHELEAKFVTGAELVVDGGYTAR